MNIMSGFRLEIFQCIGATATILPSLLAEFYNRYPHMTEGLKNYLLHSNCIGLISMYAIKYSSDYNLFCILTLKNIRIERDLCFILLSQNETQALSCLFIEQVCILAKNIYGQSNCLCDV